VTKTKEVQMVSSVLERELHQQLEHLPYGQQRQVLDFARALVSTRSQGVAGRQLLQFVGTIESGDLEEISQAITDGCEKVDKHELISMNGKYLLDTDIAAYD
jgi:hypothetical protein